MVKGRKLNIAMLGHKHMLSREGGIEIVVFNLSTRFVEMGHKVVCYDRSTHHISGSVKLDERREYNGVKIVPVWTIERKGLAAMTSSLSAAWKASRSSADVVHIHAEGPAVMCALVKLLGKKINGKKKRIVVTIHGLDWKRAKWNGFASKYIKFGEQQAVKWADEIIVLSRGVQDYFQKEYKRRTVFIPNGVSRPVPVPADEIKKQWGLQKDSYVLFLGRIVPEKGVRYLVEAWKDIKTDKKLVIAGGSSDTQAFMDELKREGEGIIFTGFQQGRILEELYSNSYIYCLPSDLEGMPLSLLEAMSYGNCCVVSDIQECAEVVEDKAVTFSHGDVAALRSVLQELLENEARVAKYKKTAADFITSKYNWDDVVNRTLDLYLGQ